MSNSLHEWINRERVYITWEWREGWQMTHIKSSQTDVDGYQKGLLATALMSSLLLLQSPAKKRSNDIYGDVMMMMSLVAINLGVELTAAAWWKRERNRGNFKLNKEPYTLILPSFCNLLWFNEWHAFNHREFRREKSQRLAELMCQFRKESFHWHFVVTSEGSWKVHSSIYIHCFHFNISSEKDMFLPWTLVTANYLAKHFHFNAHKCTARDYYQRKFFTLTMYCHAIMW